MLSRSAALTSLLLACISTGYTATVPTISTIIVTSTDGRIETITTDYIKGNEEEHTTSDEEVTTWPISRETHQFFPPSFSNADDSVTTVQMVSSTSETTTSSGTSTSSVTSGMSLSTAASSISSSTSLPTSTSNVLSISDSFSPKDDTFVASTPVTEVIASTGTIEPETTIMETGTIPSTTFEVTNSTGMNTSGTMTTEIQPTGTSSVEVSNTSTGIATTVSETRRTKAETTNHRSTTGTVSTERMITKISVPNSEIATGILEPSTTSMKTSYSMTSSTEIVSTSQTLEETTNSTKMIETTETFLMETTMLGSTKSDRTLAMTEVLEEEKTESLTISQTETTGKKTSSSAILPTMAGMLIENVEETEKVINSTLSVPNKKPYNPIVPEAACKERCPPYAFLGVDNSTCISQIPEKYTTSYMYASSYCNRNKTTRFMDYVAFLNHYDRIQDYLAETNQTSQRGLILYTYPLKMIDHKSYGYSMNSVTLGGLPKPLNLSQKLENYTGFCLIPTYCGMFSCKVADFYRTMDGLLHQPMPEETLKTGESLDIPCMSPSITVLRVICDSAGRLLPVYRAKDCKVPRSFAQETSTPNNKKIKESCDECDEFGTEKCVPVDGGFVCQCQPGWSKYSCWKSGDSCWIPPNTTDKCNGRGVCNSLPDGEFYCNCSGRWGGPTCEMDFLVFSYLGNKTAPRWLHPGQLVVIGSLAAEIVINHGTNQWLPYIFKIQITSYHPVREMFYFRRMMFSGVLIHMLLTGSRTWGTLSTYTCRLAVMFSKMFATAGFGFLYLEAINLVLVVRGKSRNRWEYEPEEMDPSEVGRVIPGKRRWYLSKGLWITFPIMLAVVIEARFAFYLWDELPYRVHSCLTTVFDFDWVKASHLLITGAMVFNTLLSGYFATYIEFREATRIAEQKSFFEWFFHSLGQEAFASVHRTRRNILITPIVLYFWYVVILATQDYTYYGNDWNETPLRWMCLAAFFGYVGILLLDVCTQYPEIVNWLMITFLPYVPSFPWPTFSPIEHWSREECLAYYSGKILPENEDWPVALGASSYVSIERRHQTMRRMTRYYLGLRLKGMNNTAATDQVAVIVKKMLKDDYAEEKQYLRLFQKWIAIVRDLEERDFTIPDNDISNWMRGQRLLYVPNTVIGHIAEENKRWDRYERLYWAMGYMSPEPMYYYGTSPLWARCVKEVQCVHVCLQGYFRLKTLAYEKYLEKEGSDISQMRKHYGPELYDDTLFPPLRDLPGAERYLLNEFYNTIHYGNARYAAVLAEVRGYSEMFRQKIEEALKNGAAANSPQIQAIIRECVETVGAAERVTPRRVIPQMGRTIDREAIRMEQQWISRHYSPTTKIQRQYDLTKFRERSAELQKHYSAELMIPECLFWW